MKKGKSSVWIWIILIVIASYFVYSNGYLDNLNLSETNPVKGCWEISRGFGYKTVMEFKSDGVLVREQTGEPAEILGYELLEGEVIKIIETDGKEFLVPYLVAQDKSYLNLEIEGVDFLLLKCGTSNIDEGYDPIYEWI
jgi:hypothetical protein